MGKFITRTGMRNLYKRGSDYVVVVTDPNGKRVWKALGAVAEWKKRKPRELEDKVRELRNAIKAGKSADGPETFERVFDDFMARYVEEKKLRTAKDIRRNVTNHVLPVWGARDFIVIQNATAGAGLWIGAAHAPYDWRNVIVMPCRVPIANLGYVRQHLVGHHRASLVRHLIEQLGNVTSIDASEVA